MPSSFDINIELESEEYKKEWKRHIEIFNSFIRCLQFCVMDFRRSSDAKDNFFIRASDDIMQSVVSINLLAEQGIRNTCRRELRYLIELSIKACYISQNSKNISYEDQVIAYEDLLKTPKINYINSITLYFLKNNMDSNFKSEVKRSYGLMSNFVHATPKLMKERIKLAEAGRYIGFEGTNELRELNDEVEKIYSYVLIMLFHSVPLYVVGDLFVESDGYTSDLVCLGSKYIAIIDECFDYKHERQDKISEIKEKRTTHIRY